MDDRIYKDMKYNTSRLYMLCNKMWPHEFKNIYQGNSALFRMWLNEKTGLNIDNRQLKHKAIKQWLDALEKMAF